MDEARGKGIIFYFSKLLQYLPKALTSLQLLPWTIHHAFFLPLHRLEERKGEGTGGG